MVRHDLRHAERRLQPVEDGEPVPHHARECLRRAQREQGQRPDGECTVVVVDDPALDGAADRERHERLRDHPEHAEAHPEKQGDALLPPDPDQKPRGRARIGVAGVGDRQFDRQRKSHAEAREAPALRS